ncbi:hypothetical protein IU449_27180 [Nocardia higoensis]|uniref:Transposase n=1 Tax=Nocardia higoensis TaxID=228599 RepID=A0ABS0DMC4_9NOCA|nr:hypothetical protein [Nocardia higoensis]MBF6358184.1 hypothetical protein [Nocardia higoensis]
MIRASHTEQPGRWIVVEKTHPDTWDGERRSEHQSLQAAFRAVAIDHGGRGVWKELIYDTWEIGKEVIDSDHVTGYLNRWQRGAWYVTWVPADDA